METTHRKSGYGPVSLIRDRTVTVIDEMNDLGETLLVRAILRNRGSCCSWPACNSGYGVSPGAACLLGLPFGITTSIGCILPSAIKIIHDTGGTAKLQPSVLVTATAM